MQDEQTINTYNLKAEEYDSETSAFWDQFPRTFLNKFVELSGKKIINIGSGPGRDGLLLQNFEKEVICIDASQSMIDLSRERGLQSILSGFDSLPFQDGEFDGAWAYTSLLHTPKKNIDAPLEEIYRVLKNQGIFALGLIEGEGEEYKTSSGVDSPRLFSFYKKDEVIKLCNKHGFYLLYFEEFKPRSKNYLNFIFKKI